MKATVSAIAFAVMLGCASSSGERQTPPRTASDAPDAGAPAKAAAPAAPAAPKDGVVTAAEAAEKAHEDWVRCKGSQTC